MSDVLSFATGAAGDGRVFPGGLRGVSGVFGGRRALCVVGGVRCSQDLLFSTPDFPPPVVLLAPSVELPALPPSLPMVLPGASSFPFVAPYGPSSLLVIPTAASAFRAPVVSERRLPHTYAPGVSAAHLWPCWW